MIVVRDSIRYCIILAQDIFYEPIEAYLSMDHLVLDAHSSLLDQLIVELTNQD